MVGTGGAARAEVAKMHVNADAINCVMLEHQFSIGVRRIPRGRGGITMQCIDHCHDEQSEMKLRDQCCEIAASIPWSPRRLTGYRVRAMGSSHARQQPVEAAREATLDPSSSKRRSSLHRGRAARVEIGLGHPTAIGAARWARGARAYPPATRHRSGCCASPFFKETCGSYSTVPGTSRAVPGCTR